MKKILILIGVAALLATATQAQTTPGTSIWTDIGNAFGSVFKNNPTNTWDVSMYGLNDISKSKLDIKDGWGAGVRVGYWLSPAIGASVDVSYCDASWTFASLGLTARATFNVGSFASVTPYVVAGPGWNVSKGLNGVTGSVVAVAGAGGELDIKAVKWCKFFGEYSRVIGSGDVQERVQFGIKKTF